MSEDSFFDLSEPKQLILIEGEQARVFRATAYLLSEPKELVFQNPVPVRGVGGRNTVGYASLYADSGLLGATVVMDYMSAERLLIQTEEYPLWVEAKLAGNMVVELALTTQKPASPASRLMALE